MPEQKKKRDYAKLAELGFDQAFGPVSAEEMTSGPGFAGRAINEVLPDFVKAGGAFFDQFKPGVDEAFQQKSLGDIIKGGLEAGTIGPAKAAFGMAQGLYGMGKDALTSLGSLRTGLQAAGGQDVPVPQGVPEAGGRLAGNLMLALLLGRTGLPKRVGSMGKTVATPEVMPKPALPKMLSAGKSPIPMGPSSIEDASFVRGVPAHPTAPGGSQFSGDVLGALERAGLNHVRNEFYPREGVGHQPAVPAVDPMEGAIRNILANLPTEVGETPGFGAASFSDSRPFDYAMGVNPEFPFSPEEFNMRRVAKGNKPLKSKKK